MSVGGLARQRRILFLPLFLMRFLQMFITPYCYTFCTFSRPIPFLFESLSQFSFYCTYILPNYTYELLCQMNSGLTACVWHHNYFPISIWYLFFFLAYSLII